MAVPQIIDLPGLRLYSPEPFRAKALQVVDVFQIGLSKNVVYFVYAIRSRATGRIYIGQTGDLEGRIREHNAGSVKSTKKDCPWELYAWERFMNRKEAMHVEWKIKRSKGLRERWLEANKAGPSSLMIGS